MKRERPVLGLLAGMAVLTAVGLLLFAGVESASRRAAAEVSRLLFEVAPPSAGDEAGSTGVRPDVPSARGEPLPRIRALIRTEVGVLGIQVGVGLAGLLVLGLGGAVCCRRRWERELGLWAEAAARQVRGDPAAEGEMTSRSAALGAAEEPLNELIRGFRDYLDRIADAVPLGLAVTDPRGRVVSWNRTVAEMTGWDRAHVVGSPWQEPGGDPVPASPGNRVVKLTAEDGRDIEACWTLIRLEDGGGRPLGAVEILADVTEHRRRERRLREQEHELEATREELERVLAEERDLRGRLAAEVQASQWARQLVAGLPARVGPAVRSEVGSVRDSCARLVDGPLFLEEAECARAAARSGTRLEKLVDRVLDVFRLAGGGVELGRETFDPQVLAEAVDRGLRAAAEEKGLNLSVSVGPGFPPSVIGDPERLGQVVKELTANAVAVTDAGGVDVELSWEEGELRLAVADDGPGIAETERELLFEPFARVPQGSGAHGLGIGLSLVRGLVVAMGGELKAETDGTRGTTFRVSVPLTAGQPREAGTAEEPPEFDAPPAVAEPPPTEDPELGREYLEWVLLQTEWMEREVSERSFGDAGRRARALGGSAQLYGFDVVADHAAEVERRCVHEDGEGARGALRALARQVRVGNHADADEEVGGRHGTSARDAEPGCLGEEADAPV